MTAYPRYVTVGTVNPPAAPNLTSIAGGSLPEATYYVRAALIYAGGEAIASTEASEAVAENYLIQVASPSTEGAATGWNVYVGTASGEETRQNATPLTLGTAWTEPTSGLIGTGASPLTTTAIQADLSGVLGPTASVTLSADYAMLDPGAGQYPFRPFTVGRDAGNLQYPRTIASGTTILLFTPEAAALVSAGAATYAE